MTQVEESAGTSPTGRRPPLSGWPGVVALALGTFTVVTSEMLPVGLLTPMGGSPSGSRKAWPVSR